MGAAPAPPTSEIVRARSFSRCPRALAAAQIVGDDRQRASDKIQVHMRIDREQCALIQLDAACNIRSTSAGENNAGIDELTALDAPVLRHNA